MIGICAAIHRASWTVWEGVEANISPRRFSAGVAGAAGLPLLLPPEEGSAEDPDQLLDALDALLLTGGADLDPSLYGAAARAETQPANLERDRFEAALAAGALERDMPVLGICRGMQLLNVIRGGTLEQHLDTAERHLRSPGAFVDHAVRLDPGSLAARVAGADRITVRSHHHQGLARLGDGVVASAWSEPDGLIEAIELPGQRFALGVLWHDEEERGSRFLRALADEARAQAVRV